MQSPATAPAPDRAAALAQYRDRAARYDSELAAFEPIRAECITLLGLAPGATVLDVGCGTGLSFAALRGGVRRNGRVVGIEQCPEMLAVARERVQRHGWHNVHLLDSPACAAPLPGQADAALFHFTHDVLREPAALDNVFAHLRPGARVVACGLQWAPPWMWLTNAFVAMAALYSVSSLEGMARPWDRLGDRLQDLQVRTLVTGGIYIATGTVPA